MDDGLLIVWSGPIKPAGKSEIHAQKNNYNLDGIGEQVIINDIGIDINKKI